MISMYLDESDSNMYSDVHESATSLQQADVLPPIPTAESFRHQRPSHSFAVDLSLDTSSFHVTNVQAADVQQYRDASASGHSEVKQEWNDASSSIELPGLAHHVSLGNMSQSESSHVANEEIGTHSVQHKADRDGPEIFSKSDGVVEWIASRDATEHSRQPILMSTETGIPLYFEVPPLLRWLESRGLNLPPEMARHYYNMFK
jgi:hypothetical protein